MSVHRVVDLGHDLPDADIAIASGSCFYCGEEIQDFVVFWQGFSISFSQLALHPKCAKSLALHLGKDGIIGDHLERDPNDLYWKRAAGFGRNKNG